MERVERALRKRFLELTGPMGRRVVVAADALGHTFGVRVQWTRLRREGSEGSKGSKGSEGGGGSSAAIFKVSVTGLAVCVICDTISSATYFLVSP